MTMNRAQGAKVNTADLGQLIWRFMSRFPPPNVAHVNATLNVLRFIYTSDFRGRGFINPKSKTFFAFVQTQTSLNRNWTHV